MIGERRLSVFPAQGLDELIEEYRKTVLKLTRGCWRPRPPVYPESCLRDDRVAVNLHELGEHGATSSESVVVNSGRKARRPSDVLASSWSASPRFSSGWPR